MPQSSCKSVQAVAPAGPQLSGTGLCGWPPVRADLALYPAGALQTGNLYAVSQFLCNASKSLSGTLADFLSPARMVIFGTLLTTINKPMFAMSGYVYASFGTVACLYWVTAGKVFDR